MKDKVSSLVEMLNNIQLLNKAFYFKRALGNLYTCLLVQIT